MNDRLIGFDHSTLFCDTGPSQHAVASNHDGNTDDVAATTATVTMNLMDVLYLVVVIGSWLESTA
jgi:hypothetical protein